MSGDVVGAAGWPEAEARLAALVAGLAPGGFVTITPPPPAAAGGPGEPADPARRGGLLGRLRGRREAARDRPLVQLSLTEEHLDAECSGPAGGSRASTAYPWDADQQHGLLELGWESPEELDDWQMYRWYRRASGGSQQNAADAAHLVVATLRDVYGLASPEGVEIVGDVHPR